MLQLFLILLNAVFACAEIAVLSINETVLERKANDGDRRAKRLFRLTREPAKFLATIQVAITLSGFLGSAFAADNFAEPLVKWVIGLGLQVPEAVLQPIAVVLITLILSYFTLVFGELVPKRLAMKKAEGVAMGVSGVVNVISIIFKPIVAFLSLSTNLVLKLFGIDPNQAEDDVNEAEILMMVDAGSENGAIETHERELIQNVFDFNDIEVSEIVTRRADIICLAMDESDEEWLETIRGSRHTRYPIYEGDIDNIVGILNTKDYFRLDDRSRECVMEEAVTNPYFVPENITADVLFKNMKATRNSLAVVIDEYGSVGGIVTFSDLIEELVGEIVEDDDEEYENRPHLERLDDFSWEVFGNVAIEDIEKELSVSLGIEDFDTITGISFDVLGAIPDDGECEITVELGKITINIKKIESHCVANAVITKKEEENEEEKKENDRDTED